jgi:hypothetical protein
MVVTVPKPEGCDSEDCLSNVKAEAATSLLQAISTVHPLGGDMQQVRAAVVTVKRILLKTLTKMTKEALKRVAQKAKEVLCAPLDGQKSNRFVRPCEITAGYEDETVSGRRQLQDVTATLVMSVDNGKSAEAEGVVTGEIGTLGATLTVEAGMPVEADSAWETSTNVEATVTQGYTGTGQQDSLEAVQPYVGQQTAEGVGAAANLSPSDTAQLVAATKTTNNLNGPAVAPPSPPNSPSGDDENKLLDMSYGAGVAVIVVIVVAVVVGVPLGLWYANKRCGVNKRKKEYYDHEKKSQIQLKGAGAV